MNATLIFEVLLTAVRERGTMGAYIIYELEGRHWFIRFTWDVEEFGLWNPISRDKLKIEGCIIGVGVFKAHLWGEQTGGKAFPDLFVPHLDTICNDFEIIALNEGMTENDLSHHFMIIKLQGREPVVQ